MKVTHIITGLSAHGAEMMLYRFLAASNPEEYQSEVISLTDRGALGDQIESLGVPVHALGMRPGMPNPIAIRKLAKMLRKSRPHLVQGWMYHANLLGGLAARMAGGDIPVVWGIHHNKIERHDTKFLTRLTVRLSGKLSDRLAAGIICCSKASAEAHVAMGYSPEKIRVIPNGIDLEQFHNDPNAGAALREDLNIPSTVPLIGLAARFHPNKDHKTFFRAAGILHKEFPDVHFVLCGDGLDTENSAVAIEIFAAGLQRHCHMLGARSDMQRIYPALDIATNSSVSEAFPLAIGEAMACEVPVVATDVGDSALIVGDTGKVVPARSPELIARAWRDLLNDGPEVRRKLGAAARARIAEHFSLAVFVENYQNLYQTLIKKVRGVPAASLVDPKASTARADANSA